jgi:hypothetical protein
LLVVVAFAGSGCARFGYDATERNATPLTTDAATVEASSPGDEDASAADADIVEASPPGDEPAETGPVPDVTVDAVEDVTVDAVEDMAAEVTPDAGPDTGSPPGDYVAVFSKPAETIRNGDAVINGTSLDLTQGENIVAGSAYLPWRYPIGPNTVFAVSFTFEMYGGDGTNGGDGLVLVWQSAGPNALGNPGSQLGYDPGVTPSVGVGLVTCNGTCVPASHHVSVLGSGKSWPALASTFTVPYTFNDGLPHNVWIDYDGATQTLNVYLGDTTKPATAALTTSVDLVALVGNMAYVGFTGSSGGARNVQEVQAMTVRYRY